jgi:NAD(P)-dependent dehydrogenase (short-subunit alcohol dehydrogenase family)
LNGKQDVSETAEELSSLHPSGNFVAIKFNVDLSSIECVRESAKDILQEYFAEGAPLDVLICNAGLAGVPNRWVLVRHELRASCWFPTVRH